MNDKKALHIVVGQGETKVSEIEKIVEKLRDVLTEVAIVDFAA